MKKKKKYIKKSKGCYLGNIDKDIKRLKEKMELAKYRYYWNSKK